MSPPLLLLAALLAVWGAPSTAPADRPLVILLSWDGVRQDYPDRAALPGLARMVLQGVRAERLVPVFPSNTFPNHVSLATGAYADVHGILDNRFLDRKRGLFSYESDASWIQAEPLWVTAERQGVRAAVFFWVGSETDWNGAGASYRRAPFDDAVGEAEKLRQILAWVDLPPSERPGLIMSYWRGTDHVAHRKGPDHGDVTAALREQDRQLQALLEGIDARGLWADTTVLIVSDHGMTTASESVPVRESLEEAGIEARVVHGASVAHVFLADGADLERARERLARLEGVSVYGAAGIPDALRIRHPDRNGDLVLVTEPPHTFWPATWGSYLRPLLGWERGAHGYAPDHPEMGGIFFALGRGVPRGVRVGAVRAIDVAPTVSRLLGIEPPAQSEGVPIPELVPGEGSLTSPGADPTHHPLGRGGAR